MRRKARQATKPENRPRFWGRHAVAAALANPERQIVRIWADPRGRRGAMTSIPPIPVTFADAADLGRLVPRDAPHQGMVAEVERLDDLLLADLLDRAEDRPAAARARPGHRSAQCRRDPALGGGVRRARRLVTQDRHAPPESGALAKAASGALETVPWVRVVNLARALDEMAEAGFWRIGLTGEAEMTLAEALGPARVALVLGAEGEGMRQNTEAHCDALARLPISGGSRASTSPTPPRSRSTRRALAA